MTSVLPCPKFWIMEMKRSLARLYLADDTEWNNFEIMKEKFSNQMP